MIKSLYNTPISASAGDNLEYSAALDACRGSIQEHADELKGITAEVLKSKVELYIMSYIDTYKPIVPEYTSNGILNKERLALRLYQDINEYGIISSSLNDTTITDIYCDGLGPGNTYIFRGRKKEILKDANGKVLYYTTVDEITSVINSLSFSSKQRTSGANPILYAETIHGHRLTANDVSVSANVVCNDGVKRKVPTYSIRLGSSSHPTFEQMVYKYKTMCPEVAEYLRLLGSVKHMKLIIAGVPGTGKTTILVEMLKKLPGRTMTIESTPEMQLWQYDKDGFVINNVKSVISNQIFDTDDITKATTRNLYYMSLREKVDQLSIGEIRSINDIVVFLEAAVAGQGVQGTIHGEDAVTTIERFVKDVCQSKHCSRSEAMAEIYLSLNCIVCLDYEDYDSTIRVDSISEVVKEETPYGITLIPKPLVRFHRYKRGVNPDTGRVYGYWEIVGTPTERLRNQISKTIMTDEEEAFLCTEASPENPVRFSEVWDD